jgi:LPXTG-site transpeptidase (sortase) family protein
VTSADQGVVVPTRIEIPRLSVHLPIYGANLDNNHWETTEIGVSYLVSSPAPGQVGNSVMYGHNWPNLLGNLRHIVPGDEIVIHMGEEPIKFAVTYTMVVPGSNTTVYQETADTRLTLYTCTGFFDKDRFVVVAHPVI